MNASPETLKAAEHPTQKNVNDILGSAMRKYDQLIAAGVGNLPQKPEKPDEKETARLELIKQMPAAIQERFKQDENPEHRMANALSSFNINLEQAGDFLDRLPGITFQASGLDKKEGERFKDSKVKPEDVLPKRWVT